MLPHKPIAFFDDHVWYKSGGFFIDRTIASTQLDWISMWSSCLYIPVMSFPPLHIILLRRFIYPMPLVPYQLCITILLLVSSGHQTFPLHSIVWGILGLVCPLFIGVVVVLWGPPSPFLYMFSLLHYGVLDYTGITFTPVGFTYVYLHISNFFSTFLLYNIFELTTWRKSRYLSTCPTEMLKCASMGVSIYVPVRSTKCSALAVLLSCSILWTMHYPQYCIPVSIHYRIKSAVARLW